ncbi:MAG TPA: tRNA lysidine(34) synthetase TilS [Candidatus Saccharimonadales bacterium]|nr:tRNA lysidine(34) synthetase TilS [Candidatus Saccharimonadales bacterium]
MRYLVAVSGGIDSVVLLDKLASSGEHELIVAHFDHGIRGDSADDARFVSVLAALYGLPFVSTREELGEGASEERARHRRYAFLRQAARMHEAMIATAHHADDVIETIAINIQRGTGWRGVAVLTTPGIERPLLAMTKADIRAYALKKRLEWVEDSTNASEKYLRNRLRHRITAQLSSQQKQAAQAIWQQQLALKTAIEQELANYSNAQGEYSRYYLAQIDEQSASELLRAAIMAKTNLSPTRPQLKRALLAIKTARPRTSYELGAGVKLWFNVRTFIVETP